MKYTVDQQKILDDNSKNLLVSASAGSGKTATIIQKIFELISNQKIDISKLLVITFTESASSEMKIRLKQILRENASGNEFLQSQLDKLPLSDISTLHSFCAKMIRKFFFYVDLKPNFVVLNEFDTKYLKVKALEKTIKIYSKSQDDDFVKLSNIFDGGRNFESFKKNILSFSDFLNSVDDKTKFIDKIATKMYNDDFDNNVACSYLNNYVVSNIKYLNNQIDSVIINAKNCKAEFYLQLLTDLKKQLSMIDSSKNFEYNRNACKGIVFPKLTNKKLSNEDNEFKPDFVAYWDKAKKRVEEIKNNIIIDKDEDTLKQDLNSLKKFLEKFIEVVQCYENLYENAKQKRNGLDFNDLEKYFLKLLDYDEVKQATQFEYIFVDEYQDINMVQEKILGKISSHNMVMVGDIKQSIYAFRNSTPDIFVGKSKKYSIDANQGNLINLNENFRSNSIILEFVNQIFDRCMSEDFGGIEYKKNGQLIGQAQYEICSDIPVVEVDIVDSAKEDGESEEKYDKVYSVLNDKNNYSQEMTKARKEAMLIASKILDIVGKDYYDSKQKSTKKITFSDIAILCRNNDFLKEIAKVLLEYRVPIETNLIDNIYNNKDVVVLIDLLKIINNFHDDNSLSVVMTSKLFEFSFEQLAKIRSEVEDEEFFYDAVKTYVDMGHDGLIKRKIITLLNFLDNAKNQLVYKSIYEFLLDVCNENGYFDYLLSLPDGSNRQKIVKDFIETISQADYNYDLVGFVDYIENYAKDTSFKSSLVGGVSSVKLGTIHSSKGLEYPIVFLVGCGNAFSNKTFLETILRDKDFGLGIYSYDLESFKQSQNLARNCITLHKRKLERAEELRLLYVALTRAKNHLFVIGSSNLKNIQHIDSIENAKGMNSYLPWIISMLSPVNFVNLTQNKKSLCQKLSKGEVIFNVYNDDYFVFDNKEGQELQLNLFDKNICNTLKENLNFEFKKKEKISLKNSVSSLLLENSEQDNINLEPKKLSVYEGQKPNIDGAKLGTIVHNILQEIDFNKDYSREELNKIISAFAFEEQYARQITADKINNCINCIRSFGTNLKFKKELPFISYIPYSSIFNSERNDKVLVQGIADLIVIAEDKYYLIDYKTTKVKNADQLVEKYKLQLKLYLICLEKALHISFEGAYLYSFCLEKLIKIF